MAASCTTTTPPVEQGSDAMDTTQAADAAAASLRPATTLPGQVVLVFQGGGALGAYQGGVYQALHEAGIEPNWVIGTSIGAVNGAIIAGNAFDKRLDCIRQFWMRMERTPFWGHAPRALLAGNLSPPTMTRSTLI